MNKVFRLKSAIAYIVKCGVALNQKDLGCKMGYSNESSFSQVINGKVQMPKDFMDRLKSFAPDLNIDWIETGSGDMLKSIPQPSAAESSSLPPDYVLLVPVSAQGGTLNEFEVSVKDNDCEKVISPIRGIDYAVSVSGDSMSPEYPNGSRVFIKKINEKAFIEWGKVYVLDTCNGTVIKILAPSDDPGKIRCLSINPDPIYAPFEVSLEDVNGIYRVLLCMSVK